MWEDFEFDPERIPLFKLIFHCAQIGFAFICWILEIVVFRADGAAINGNNGWTFAVVSDIPPGKSVQEQRLTPVSPSASSPYPRGSI